MNYGGNKVITKYAYFVMAFLSICHFARKIEGLSICTLEQSMI